MSYRLEVEDRAARELFRLPKRAIARISKVEDDLQRVRIFRIGDRKNVYHIFFIDSDESFAELAVIDPDSGEARWSVDHVFLDQDAVPTLVEVKRSTDSRIRREVVGQMLDYAAQLLDWAKERGLRIWWGKGRYDGSFFPLLEQQETRFTFSVWTYGRIEIQFQHMVTRPVFDEETRREELRRRFNEIPGVEIPPNAIARRPTIPVAELSEASCLARFLETWDWYLGELRGPRAEGMR